MKKVPALGKEIKKTVLSFSGTTGLYAVMRGRGGDLGLGEATFSVRFPSRVEGHRKGSGGLRTSSGGSGVGDGKTYIATRGNGLPKNVISILKSDYQRTLWSEGGRWEALNTRRILL